MNHGYRLLIALIAAPLLAACGGDQEAADPAVDPPASAMEGMQGMGGPQMGSGMMAEMRAHMQAMEGETGEDFQDDLPRHRQMVANMISQMNREMREMNMQADSEWNSAIEAVREDLRRLPEMSAQELEDFMPSHRARVMRLLDMHEDMMGEMRM